MALEHKVDPESRRAVNAAVAAGVLIVGTRVGCDFYEEKNPATVIIPANNEIPSPDAAIVPATSTITQATRNQIILPSSALALIFPKADDEPHEPLDKKFQVGELSGFYLELEELRNNNALCALPTSLVDFFASKGLTLEETKEKLSLALIDGDPSAFFFSQNLVEEILLGRAFVQPLYDRRVHDTPDAVETSIPKPDPLFQYHDRIRAIRSYMEDTMGITEDVYVANEGAFFVKERWNDAENAWSNTFEEDSLAVLDHYDLDEYLQSPRYEYNDRMASLTQSYYTFFLALQKSSDPASMLETFAHAHMDFSEIADQVEYIVGYWESMPQWIRELHMMEDGEISDVLRSEVSYLRNF